MRNKNDANASAECSKLILCISKFMSFSRRRTLQELGVDSAHSGWYVIFHPFIKETAAPFPTLVGFSFRKKGPSVALDCTRQLYFKDVNKMSR